MRYDQVDQAVSEGRLWRAKEILQGRLSSPHFDRDLLFRYGGVLLAMGDLIEAGRMLFSSGARGPQYHEAIHIFLERHPRSDPARFLFQLPPMLRRQRHLAEFLSSPDFERNGWTEAALDRIQGYVPKSKIATKKDVGRIKKIAISAISITIGIFIILSFVIGAFSIIRFFWRHLG